MRGFAPYLLYTLVAGILIGILFSGSDFGRGGSPIVVMEGMDHDMNPSGKHEHGAYDITDGPVPSLQLTLVPDPEIGWNLQIDTKNFEFRLPQADALISANAGHAHLYINGKKHARLYGPLFHLDDLGPGENRVTVTLNTDDHQGLMHEGQVIEASLSVDAHAGK